MAILTTAKHDQDSVTRFLNANNIGMVPDNQRIITWGRWAYAPTMSNGENARKRKQWRLFGTGNVFDYEYPAKRIHRLKYPLNQFIIRDKPQDEDDSNVLYSETARIAALLETVNGRKA